MGDVGQPVLTPARQDLGAQQRPVAVERAGLQAGLGGQPLPCPGIDRDPAALRGRPGLRNDRRRLLVEPALGVEPFSSKGLLVSDKRWSLSVAGNRRRHFIGR
jgi:hypothetical protein